MLISFMAGITGAFLYVIPDVIALFLLLICLSGILMMLLKENIRHAFVLVTISLFSLGILHMNRSFHPHLAKDHIVNFVSRDENTVEGVICENPIVSIDRTQIVASTSRILISGKYIATSGLVLLNIRKAGTLRYGDLIRFRCKLRIPRNYKNPGAFDYEQYLRLRGIRVRGFVDSETEYVVLRRGVGNPIRLALEKYRAEIRELVTHKSPGAEGQIISAMLLGDQQEIPKEIMEQFNKTGTTHIIAISGFNIGIVAIFCIYLFRFIVKSSTYLLLRSNVVVLSNACAIIFVILYSFIAGSSISVIRAAIMVTVFMAALFVDRRRDHYNTLALAALLILTASPYALFDVSFQLSFVAVVFLLFLTPRFIALLPASISFPSVAITRQEKLLSLFKRVARNVIIFILVSFSAMIGTLPLIILYFNRLSLVALAANVVVVPILGVLAIPIFLLIILVMPISTAFAEIIVAISESLVKFSLALVSLFADHPWSSVYISTPTLYEVAAFYLFLVSMGFCLDGWINRNQSPLPKERSYTWKILPLVVIIFFIVNGGYLYINNLNRDKLSLTAVDVGQGNAALIRFPGGTKMLVDGGGSFDGTFDLGKYVLAPFLWHERIDQIDILVLTHPHPDHLQGLLFIMNNFRVSEVWINDQSVDSPLYGAFHLLIGERKIRLKVVSEQTPRISIDQVDIRILNPHTIRDGFLKIRDRSSMITTDDYLRASHYSVPDQTNDHSVVMKLTYKRSSFLLTGDITERAERRIIESGADLKSDLIIVPHHGGFRSSSTPFLEKVKPQIAVISCGVDNRFEDPHPDVIKRLDNLKILHFRTDSDGAVHIESDGSRLAVRTFIKS